MPVSARSRPVVTLSQSPDWARKIPDSRHPDASIRAAVLANCGVSTLAVRLKMCVGELAHGPSSASNSASGLAGGLMSDTGSM